MKIDNTIETTLSQTKSFAESNLPKTMQLADKLRFILMSELDESTDSLPFPDRVLAWLTPSMRRDIVLFHGGKGGALDDLIERHAISHLDDEFCMELSARTKKMRPDLAEWIEDILLTLD